MSVVRLIVVTRSSGPPANGKIIKEMPGSVASGTPYIYTHIHTYMHTFIHMRGTQKFLKMLKKIYLKYSYKFETLVPFKVLPPVTECSDPSIAPTAGIIA